MPGWYEKTRALVEAGKLQLVGLIQEQHAERCRLFMQWKRMDFPILVDSLNRTGIHAVPLVWAIDEHGVLRSTRPRPDWVAGEFMSAEYAAPTERREPMQPSPADRRFLDGEWTKAITAYEKLVLDDATDAESWFRLGCSYRARHDSGSRVDGDFQSAIDAWTTAQNLRPRNYIFRRRIQQYGPRLQKPYPFYDWVASAQKEITARGEKAHVLRVGLEGSELAGRLRAFPREAGDVAEPDPVGKLPVDRNGLVTISSVVAPRPFRAGTSTRIYLRFRPNDKRKATWDNESGPLQVWLKVPRGWRQSRSLLTAPPRADKASSKELRTLELEVSAPREAATGAHTLSGYAVYYVCDGIDGLCTYVRQDFDVKVTLLEPPPQRRRGRRR